MKKAQGMPINVIIIAVLALLVLVILALIFTGKISGTITQVDQCKGQCVAPDGCGGQYKKTTNDPCFGRDGKVDTTVVCCVGV